MNLSSEVGLQLLLRPLGSNVVVRAACCSAGIVFPVYSTFKAIENKDESKKQRWLIYWAVYGSFSTVEVFADKILSWFPLYYHAKFAFLVWLQLPSANGAKNLYMRHLRPFLLRHQARFDQILDYVYTEMSKFIKVHQAEIKYARKLSIKVLASVNQTVKEIMPRTRNPTIEGPTRQIQPKSEE